MGIFAGLFLSVAAVFFSLWGISLYLGPDDLKDCSNPNEPAIAECQKADAIAAISGGDTEARAGEAISLYQKGWADRLIFSGAALDDDGPSNAMVMKRLALAAGVAETQILIDETARDTSENAKETRRLAPEARRVIVVTSAYHQRRASIEFKSEFKGATIVNHPVPADSQWSQYWWVTPYGWWLVLGELVKIAFLAAGGTSL